MQIYDDKKNRIGMITEFKNRAITKTLNSGDRELSFEYPANGAMIDLLKEEYYIRTKEDEFVIKAVEAGEQYNKYTAVLNVEELEGQSFPYGFASKEQTARACLEFAFEGTGWIVGVCDIIKKRSIDIEEATTAWGVLQSCLSTYRCECEINTLKKRIDIYAQIGRDRGCYFVEGLNLRKLTAASDTYEFYTRIIPIGKDGITIEWLHGKEYLENYQYSSKVKTYTWKDERYTNTTSLLEDAQAKLEELSKPYKVYAADVVDLAKANPEYKNILDFSIGDTVMMVSKHKRIREKQRIVKIVEYPETPEKNTVELSNTTKTFAEVQKTETELAKTEAISIANRTVKKVLQEDYLTTEEIETKITASKEKIELSVSHTLEDYTKKSETEAKIQLAMEGITLSVENEESSSTITLSGGGIETQSRTITMNGMVTFNDLSKEGSTTINGSNITTGELKAELIKAGKISSQNGKVYFDLTNNELVCDKITTTSTIKAVVGMNAKIGHGKLYSNGQGSSYYSIYGLFISKEGEESLGVGIQPGTSSLKPSITTSQQGFSVYNIANYGSNGGDSCITGVATTGKGYLSIFGGNSHSVISDDGVETTSSAYSGRILLSPRYIKNGNTYESCGNVLVAGGKIELRGNTTSNSFTCTGIKSRKIKTDNYGDILQYCYEMPSPMFGDIGCAETDNSGICFVAIDEIFNETVNSEMEYYVFLQCEKDGRVWIEEKNNLYFKVCGTPNTKFVWEMKVKQKDFEYMRMESGAEMEGRDFDYEGEGIKEMIMEKEKEDEIYENID